MSKTALIGIVLVIIVLLAGVFFVTNKAAAPTTSTNQNAAYDAAAGLPPTSTDTNTSAPASMTPPASEPMTVVYTANGFSPKTLTVKAGTTVRFVNNSSGQMLVASNPHPIHNGYDGTTRDQHCAAGATPSFDECTPVAPGTVYSFTFNKVGSWGYHNHLHMSDMGTIVVTK